MTARNGKPSRGFRLRRMVGAAKATRRGLAGDGPTPIYDALAAAQGVDPLPGPVAIDNQIVREVVA